MAFSPSSAVGKLKAKGNAAFKKRQWSEAAECYEAGVEVLGHVDDVVVVPAAALEAAAMDYDEELASAEQSSDIEKNYFGFPSASSKKS